MREYMHVYGFPHTRMSAYMRERVCVGDIVCACVCMCARLCVRVCASARAHVPRLANLRKPPCSNTVGLSCASRTMDHTRLLYFYHTQSSPVSDVDFR